MFDFDAKLAHLLNIPDERTYQPLRITAWLQCGVVTDGTLPIDGILHYQHMRRELGDQVVTLPGTDLPHRDTPDMQLARRNPGPQWYYAASFAQWDGTTAEGTDHWNKRFDQGYADLVDFRGKRGKVIVEQGAYKAYHMPVLYRHALCVRWYVVGNQAWIERLLAVTTNIGKKADQGWGAVLRWQVEPWEYDWSVTGPDGRLMRAVPQAGGILSGIRPSYWLRRNQAPCRMP